jgi:hypothetical protein
VLRARTESSRRRRRARRPNAKKNAAKSLPKILKIAQTPPKHPKITQTGRFVPDKSNIWRDSCDGYLDWVKEHVAEGCSLDASDACGDPPLVLACGNGHLSVARFLIDEGASVEAKSVMGETALARAAHNGHVDVVKFLLAKREAGGAGADASAADLGANNALHWASMRGHVEVVAALLRHEQGQRLKEARNAQGQTPLDLAQPQWSLSWRFVRGLLGEKGAGEEAGAASIEAPPARLGLAAAVEGGKAP